MRSRNLKDCVLWGLKRCLNKQKTIRSVKSGMNGFFSYILSDGQEVLIVMDKEYAHVFYDRKDAFISVYPKNDI